jgi:ubiquinol-cytochrome c reductase cytochrome b subunit
VILLVVAILSLSWLRYRSPWTARPAAQPPAVPQNVRLAMEAEAGRILFHKFGCTSCHAVAGSGPGQIGADLARMDHLYSQAELRNYILNPPVGVAMPSYDGRLADEELEHVVAFVLVAQTFRRMQE